VARERGMRAVAADPLMAENWGFQIEGGSVPPISCRRTIPPVLSVSLGVSRIRKGQGFILVYPRIPPRVCHSQSVSSPSAETHGGEKAELSASGQYGPDPSQGGEQIWRITISRTRTLGLLPVAQEESPGE
jgi:hypothetical protein